MTTTPLPKTAQQFRWGGEYWKTCRWQVCLKVSSTTIHEPSEEGFVTAGASDCQLLKTASMAPSCSARQAIAARSQQSPSPPPVGDRWFPSCAGQLKPLSVLGCSWHSCLRKPKGDAQSGPNTPVAPAPVSRLPAVSPIPALANVPAVHVIASASKRPLWSGSGLNIGKPSFGWFLSKRKRKPSPFLDVYLLNRNSASGRRAALSVSCPQGLPTTDITKRLPIRLWQAPALSSSVNGNWIHLALPTKPATTRLEFPYQKIRVPHPDICSFTCQVTPKIKTSRAMHTRNQSTSSNAPFPQTFVLAKPTHACPQPFWAA